MRLFPVSCLEWECCTFWKIVGNSFKSTNTGFNTQFAIELRLISIIRLIVTLKVCETAPGILAGLLSFFCIINSLFFTLCAKKDFYAQQKERTLILLAFTGPARIGLNLTQYIVSVIIVIEDFYLNRCVLLISFQIVFIVDVQNTDRCQKAIILTQREWKRNASSTECLKKVDTFEKPAKWKIYNILGKF